MKVTKIQYEVMIRWNSKEDLMIFSCNSFSDLLKWFNNGDMILAVYNKIWIELKHIKYEDTHKS